ncbi:unnamed protein product [Trichobilharzia regenti]|nr:unnamed protein product [Trichobilharzia regenti]
MAPQLGYWKIKGLVQSIRLLLEYLGDEYEERLYGRDDGEKWQKEKFSLGLEFPNETLKVDFLNRLPGMLKMFDDRLLNRNYLNGGSITHPDFMLYDALDVVLYMDKSCLDKFPRLVEFKKRIENAYNKLSNETDSSSVSSSAAAAHQYMALS